MRDLLILGAVNFVFIALKALQQRNVAYLRYLGTMGTSLAIATVEVYVIWTVANTGVTLPLTLALGIGGGLGCVTAMYITRGYKHR